MIEDPHPIAMRQIAYRRIDWVHRDRGLVAPRHQLRDVNYFCRAADLIVAAQCQMRTRSKPSSEGLGHVQRDGEWP